MLIINVAQVNSFNKESSCPLGDKTIPILQKTHLKHKDNKRTKAKEQKRYVAQILNKRNVYSYNNSNKLYFMNKVL